MPMVGLFFLLAFVNTILDSLKDTLVITAAGGGAQVGLGGWGEGLASCKTGMNMGDAKYLLVHPHQQGVCCWGRGVGGCMEHPPRRELLPSIGTRK
jgi:hypothetical protein